MGSVVGVGNRFGLGDMYGLSGSLLYGVKTVWVELVLLWVLMALVWVLMAWVWVLMGLMLVVLVSLVVVGLSSSRVITSGRSSLLEWCGMVTLGVVVRVVLLCGYEVWLAVVVRSLTSVAGKGAVVVVVGGGLDAALCDAEGGWL